MLQLDEIDWTRFYSSRSESLERMKPLARDFVYKNFEF